MFPLTYFHLPTDLLESARTGRPAIQAFRDPASEEMETCNRVHKNLSEALGFNVFMRE